MKLARRFGRYGYRMITGMLRAEGWEVNHKRVERIWRQEGLKVPKKQPKQGRVWLNDGSCIRLRPLYRHHVWSYDFVADRTHDGRLARWRDRRAERKLTLARGVRERVDRPAERVIHDRPLLVSILVSTRSFRLHQVGV